MVSRPACGALAFDEEIPPQAGRLTGRQLKVKSNPTVSAPTRREMIVAGASAIVAARLASAVRAAPAPKPALIDVHTHLGQCWNHTRPLTAKGLLEWMDEHGVERAVVMPVVSPESSSYPLTTDFVLAETKPHRERLIPFCSVDPRTSYTGGLRGLVDMLRKYVDRGARGFGEHKPGVAIDDSRNMTIYAAC